jgi:hypothetical protein
MQLNYSLQISSSTPQELIQFEPKELRFPLLPNKSLVSSFKITNVTDYYVGFTAWTKEGNAAASYSTDPTRGILPPRSTQELVVSREAKGDALDDIMQCKDRFFVWSTFVTEGVNAIDLEECESKSESESTELAIVFTEVSSLIMVTSYHVTRLVLASVWSSQHFYLYINFVASYFLAFKTQ